MSRFKWQKPDGHWQLVDTQPPTDGFTAVRMSEIVEAGHRPAHENGDRWGRWTLHDGALDFEGGIYYVEIARVHGLSGIADWARQVSEKRWATDADVGALVRGLLAHGCDHAA